MSVRLSNHTGKARRRVALCLSLFLLGTALSGPVRAQQDVQARVNRLENEIQTLSRAVFKGEAPPPGSLSSGSASQAAGLEVRLSQIEGEMRSLTGRLEEQSHEIRRLQEMVDGVLTDLDRRVAALESSGSAAPAAGAATTPATPAEPIEPIDTTPSYDEGFDSDAVTDPAAAPATGSAPQMAGQLGSLTQTPEGSSPADPATALYEQGYADLQKKNYEKAEAAFTEFLSRHADHSLASNAQYWLGETHYVRGNFERAARTFAESYQKYPKGPKAPDNLLKLALSLAGMGKKQDACLALTELKRQYPTGAGPVLARADREMATMGCP